MKVKCPYCSYENIPGDDRCSQCLRSLMHRDLPKPKTNDQLQTVMMTAPISDLITNKDLLVASPTDPLDKIVKVLQKENHNCILIYKKKKLVGILSTRDILKKVAGKHRDFSRVKAEDVMTFNPECVPVDAPITYVLNKMAMGGYRHVPVLEPDGRPINIVSIKDVLSYLLKRNKKA